MQNSRNNWLWYGVLFFVCYGMIHALTFATNNIEYNWRWERIVPYILNTEPKPIVSSYDGVVDIDLAKNTMRISPHGGMDEVVIHNFDQVNVMDGDVIFEGDTIATQSGWSIGPITEGLVVTLKISALSLIFSVFIGLFIGLARISANPVLKYLSLFYVEVIRGTPLLVQIFIFYFFIGTVLGLDRFTAGVASLSVFSAAYVAEIIRSGIQSIPKGQMEAARSLGMSYVQAMIYIILPQAFKRTLPPMAGQFINLIKDSSLVSVISITDLTKAGREVVSGTFAPFEVWFTVALMYLLLTGVLSWMVKILEKRMASSD